MHFSKTFLIFNRCLFLNIEDHEKIQNFSLEELMHLGFGQIVPEKKNLLMKTQESLSKKINRTESKLAKITEKPLKFPIKKKTNKVGEFSQSKEFLRKTENDLTLQNIRNLKNYGVEKRSKLIDKTSKQASQSKNIYFLRKIVDKKNFVLKGENLKK